MQNDNKNIKTLINIAAKEGVVSGESKLLNSALTKMFSKSTMHKQVENIACKIIADYESLSFSEKED